VVERSLGPESLSEQRWYAVENTAEVDSPSLLVYPERIVENIRRMIAIAGGVSRLRPHVKTHKMSEVVRLHLAAGITRFKCATLAEVEMAARAGATDVLLAHQPVGPKIAKLAALAARFPQTRLVAVVDDRAIAEQLSAAFQSVGRRLDVLLDLDVGMGRTGIVPGPDAFALYQRLAHMPHLAPRGLHAYDGHIHDTALAAREQACAAAFAPVEPLRTELREAGCDVSELVAGGTPTFPLHARYADRQLSPGTCVLWDAGYAAHFPDLDFLPAAALLTRVVSKPGANRLCLDLGHKAVAADPPRQRVFFPDLSDAEALVHSEEHLTLHTPRAGEFAVGDALYGIPQHICPTCALHARAVVITEGRATGSWAVDARDRI
jgi:D-serine deaminase-like pyridoxal phosphate-dependent protein